MLTQDSVSVKKHGFTEIDGIEYSIGQPHRKKYVNSVGGRQEVQDELLQQQQDAIFAIWGDTTTVTEGVTL